MKTINVGISGEMQMEGGMLSRRSSRQFTDFPPENQASVADTKRESRWDQALQQRLGTRRNAINTCEMMEDLDLMDMEPRRARTSSISVIDRPPQLETLYSGFAPQSTQSESIGSSLTSRRTSGTSETSISVDLETFQCAAANGHAGHIEQQQHIDHPAEGRPINFGTVVPGVYRSSYPQTEDYPFLQRLGLKTVVTLVSKEFPTGYKSFLDANGIKHHVFDMAGTKKEAIPQETMDGILSLVRNKENHPLLIHCNHGRHRTGCVVAVIRKMSGWQLTPILDEYKHFAEPKVRDCDLDYITAYNIEQQGAIMPTEETSWFANQNKVRITVVSVVVVLIWAVSQSKLRQALSAA